MTKVYVLLTDHENEHGNTDTVLLGVFATKDKALDCARNEADESRVDSSIIIKPNDSSIMDEGFHLFDPSDPDQEPADVWYVNECEVEE